VLSPKLASRLKRNLSLVAFLGLIPPGAFAASFTETVFATGGSLKATQPNSVTYGDGSVWVSYANNAPTTNYSGAGTIVQYDTAGTAQNTYSLGGSLGGLKYNPNTGQFWVLQGQDLYSQLSIINPAAKTVSSYAFSSIAITAGERAFDDVAFVGGKVFLSETNPFSYDFQPEVIVQLNNPTPSGTIAVTSTLNFSNGILAKDSRALNATPTGGLILTGRKDQALTFVTNPGQPNQTASSLHLVAAPGATIGLPGDALYAGSTSGTFYLTDSGTNTVYRVAASGLDPNTLFVDAGNEFGSVDPNTGIVTPLLYGSNLDGMTFVPDAASVPEPSSLGISAAAGALALLALLRRRFLNKALLN